MDTSKKTSLSKAAYLTRAAAIGVLALGLAAFVFMSLIDPEAGVLYGFYVGLLCLAISAVLWVLFWILRSESGSRFLYRFGWAPALALVIWVAVYLLSPQEYTISIQNITGTDITSIELRIADLIETRSELRSGQDANIEGVRVPPESALTISWVDADGNQQTVDVESRREPHYRHDGGTLQIFIYSEDWVSVGFAWHSMPIF